MKKTIEQIAKDCGLDEPELLRDLKLVTTAQFEWSTDKEAHLHILAEALYRRIEKLEEEKECHLAEIKALESAVAGNAERINSLILSGGKE